MKPETRPNIDIAVEYARNNPNSRIGVVVNMMKQARDIIAYIDIDIGLNFENFIWLGNGSVISFPPIGDILSWKDRDKFDIVVNKSGDKDLKSKLRYEMIYLEG